jgi:clan AA aspartic protease
MGTCSARFSVRHPVHAGQELQLDRLVDTGALFSQIPADVLARIGVTPSGTRAVHDADGTRDVVPVAKVDIAVEGVETATMVLCGRPGALVLLGATALETLGLVVDPTHKKLIPIDAPMAGAVLTGRAPRGRTWAQATSG